MNIIDEMALEAIKDPYFISLFKKIEISYFDKALDLQTKYSLSEEEFNDILTFADILSLSANSKHNNISLKIISCLFNDYKHIDKYNYFAKGIMLRSGNFPAYELINRENSIINSIDINIEKNIKETINKDEYSNRVFTDAQLKVINSLTGKNHFSFSGPTSFGKSFIFISYLNKIIKENSGTNIVFLVPTRALVSQTVKKLKDTLQLKDNYVLSASPEIPNIFMSKNNSFIFVFTPERLIHYFSNSNNPSIEYVFIDEAQKICSEDTRSPVYYHAISTAERKSCKLFFASPNVINTDVFLKLFNKTTEESMSIYESPVCQSRVFIDMIDKKSILYSDLGEAISLDYNCPNSLYELIKNISSRISSTPKSLIYCNTIEDTLNCAEQMAKTIDIAPSQTLIDAADEIASFIHKDYYLVDLIKKGVAFHFGKLPQRIRTIIETLYEHGEINYLFCTSTLLEGVNLPAQSIFILNNQIGNKDFKDIDFWNLAGRAGRLTKELSGNVFCIRWINKNGRWNTDKSRKLLESKEINKLESDLITGRANFYRNIYNAALDKPYTRKNLSDTEKRTYNIFSNILISQYYGETTSFLKSRFQNKLSSDVKDILKLKSQIVVPYSIINQFPMIKAKYQNEIWLSDGLIDLGEPSYENCLNALLYMFDSYNWTVEESGGRNPLIPNKDKKILKHYASLMSDWINSKSINEIIAQNIHNQEGRKIDTGYNNEGKIIELFNKNNKKHINIIINRTISEIDTIIRFTLKNYFENYFCILENKYAENNNNQNWALYMEHGTKNKRLIEFQKLGIPRHLSKLFESTFGEYYEFDDADTLINVDFASIKEQITGMLNGKEFKELYEVLDENNLIK